MQNRGSSILLSWLFAVTCGVTGKGSPAGLDGAFGAQANNRVYALAVQPGNRILVGGDFTQINRFPRNYLSRLNEDGILDASFADLAMADYTVRALVLQEDGRILVGGDFSSISGINWGHATRLNGDGSVDPTFDQFMGANGRVNTLLPVGSKFTWAAILLM